ncbi:MAG: adenylate/guanylate cyclase domain-containing protein [Kiloniellales bacterium]
MAEERVQRRLAAILAADVAGYTRLMGRDEEGTLAALTAHRIDLIEPCIAEHRGRVFKTTGDGLLAEFASVVDAVRCAVAEQDGMRERNTEVPENRRIEFRIGVNLGDVIVQDDDVFGDGVNVAARLEGLAEPGGVCVSDMVHQGIRSKLDLSFDDLGPQRVKNVGDPVRAFRVGHGDPFSSGEGDAPPLPAKPSIAVLPFDNISGDPQQEYFSDGITEDIITELSKISGLFVIARHSAFTYKGQSVTLKQVGQDLGVRYVLEGSVRKAGNRLRITAQLIDAATDHHLWAERYDRNLEDIFAVQEEVARSVASALAVALKPEEGERLRRPPTDNIEAYDIYLGTRATLWPPTRENILTARNAYRRITEIDPSFAGGHAGLSMTHSFAVMFGHSERPEEDARVAMEMAQRAVALDDQFAQAYSALGLVHTVTGQHDEGVVCARRAVDLQPGDADAQTFSAITQFFAGQAEGAYEAITTALRLDPQYVNGPYLNVLGIVCFCAGRYEESIDAFKRNVDRGGPLAPPALAFRTASFSAAGHVEEAKASAQALLDFFPAFSLARFRMLYMFKNPEDTKRVIAALRKVGLPE